MDKPTQQKTSRQSYRFYQMDLVRYYLATMVIVAHFNIIFHKNFFLPTDSGTAVGVFFGLSGFLVYASYQRCRNYKNYIFNRCKRIMPSYYIVVLSSAVFLCFMSKLSIEEYFLSSSFWKYIISNLIYLNFLHPELPGVFTEHTITAVNGSLWTLKVEWMLYLTIPLFVYLREKFRINFIKAVIGLFVISMIYRYTMDHIAVSTGKELYHRLSYQFGGQFVYFYTGVLCYQYKEHFLGHRILYISSALLLLAVRYLCTNYIPESIVCEIANHLFYPIGILTLFLILSTTKFISDKISIIGNCSYEMYLVHFPILQIFSCSSYFCSLPDLNMLLILVILIIIISYIINRLTKKIEFVL